MTQVVDVVIIGAGPYALSLSAHLNARGVRHRIVGEAMRFWRDMPAGINLKSFAYWTNISVPVPGQSFPEWCRRHGLEDHEPCKMESFTAYGLELAERFVPNLETVLATRVEAAGKEFEVHLSNGDRILTRRVVVATGLTDLKHVPEVFSDVAPDRVHHTGDIIDYKPFHGQRVAVIGAGASAIEAAALVHEAGGSSELFVRDETVKIYDRTPRERPLLERIKNPLSALGSSRKGWIVQQFPLQLRYLPDKIRIDITEQFMRPAAPWWIKERVLGKVSMNVRHEVVGARDVGEQLQIDVRNRKGTQSLTFDRVILGTGFETHAARLKFLSPELARKIQSTNKAPTLNRVFESSVPGLHFIGPLSYVSFGPLFKFVNGAGATTRALSRFLAG